MEYVRSINHKYEYAQGPKTLRPMRNQDYNHVISVKIRTGYGPGTEGYGFGWVGGGVKKTKFFP